MDMNIIDIDRIDREQETSADKYYQIGKTMDENDAQAMLNALVEKFPKIYIETLYYQFMVNKETVDSVKKFLNVREV